MALQDKNVYVKTYFRLNTSIYNFNTGFTEATRNIFDEEVKEILKQLNFEFKEPTIRAACYDGKRGSENLYCHPQHFSGFIIKESIGEIEEVLKRTKNFKLQHTDTYDEVMNYTEDELQQALEQDKENITNKILSVFITQRKNLFKPEGAIFYIESDVKFIRKPHLENIEKLFILNLFKSLIEDGKLQKAQTKSGIAYRTVKEKESKKNKRAAV